MPKQPDLFYNPTPQQRDLLFAVVDAHLSKHGSRFTLMRHHSGSGLRFADGHEIRVSADEADLDRLNREGLVVILARAPGQLIAITAELTQLGIRTAASLRNEPVTSNDGGGDERRAKPSEELKLETSLDKNPFPEGTQAYQLWTQVMADIPHRHSSAADPWGYNPFPKGTRAHENWTDTKLWAREHLALLHAEMLGSMPPEEASPTEFLEHLLNAEAGTFDIWAVAFSRSTVLTDDAAEAFEQLLGDVEKVTIGQAGKYRASFMPERLFLTELRTRLSQRKQYWTGQMLRKVREHKEASRANAVQKSGVRTEPRAVGTDPPADERERNQSERSAPSVGSLQPTLDSLDFTSEVGRNRAVDAYITHWSCSEASLARTARVNPSDLVKWKKGELPEKSDKKTRIENALKNNEPPTPPPGRESAA